VRANLIVTAFHVVGSKEARKWMHEDDEQCQYRLLVGGSELALTPHDFDVSADVALLRLDAAGAALHPLPLAMAPPQHGDRWRCDGFPRMQGDRPITLTGTIAAVRGDSVQLTTEQGTVASWKGISGAPVCNASGEVVAMLGEETVEASTMWATHVAAIRRLLAEGDGSSRYSGRAGYEALLHSYVSWLHLADLHLGAQHGRWQDMRDLALRDLEQQAEMHGPPDLILVTGDLSDSGTAEQFERVTTALREICNAVGGDPIIVPVPGNHDLARPRPGDPAAKGFRDYARDSALRELIQQGEPGACAPLQLWFKNYTDWLKNWMVPAWRRQQVLYEPGLLPGDLRLSIHLRGIRLGLIGVNSAFLHLDEENHRGKLFVERQQLGDSPSEWIERHHATFLLMHHPPAWLTDEDLFYDSIYPVERFVACFFGYAWTSPRAEVSRERPQIGALSLFGREHCNGGRNERAYGYWWGRLSQSNETQGQLRLWRRRVERTDAGRTFTPAAVDANRPEQTFDVRLREVREPTPTPQVRSISESAWTAVLQFSDESLHKAVELARASNFENGLTELRRIRAHLEEVGAREPAAEPGLRYRWLDTRLHEAGCLLGMQQLDEGSDLLRALMEDAGDEAPYLSEERRIFMAEMLAQAGDPQRARKLVTGLESKAAVAVRQVVSIVGDKIVPDDLLDDAFVRLHACGLWSEQGEHDRAAEEALRVLDMLEAEGPPTANQASVRARAVQAVLVAIGQSINEVPLGCAVVEEIRRERAIRVLQRDLDPYNTPLRRFVPDRYLAFWIANFQHLSWDRARLDAARAWLSELGEDDTRYRILTQDVPSGDVPLPENAPIWARVLDEARKLRRAGKLDEALGLVTEAIERDPERPRPLLYLEAAVLLSDKGEPAEAAKSAEKVFRAFPGHGQAIFFAWCLQQTGQAKRLWWELKAHLEDSPNIEARRLLAWAASHEAPLEAPARWHALVEGEYSDAVEQAFDRLYWAQSLAKVDRAEQATNESWKAFQSGNLSTHTDALVACVKLHWESLHPERERRLRSLLQALRKLAEERGDRLALEGYVEYWQRMGQPAELPQPDLLRSLEEGKLVVVHGEQMAEFSHALHVRRLRSEFAYAHGVLPLELRGRAEMREQAEMFEWMLKQQQLVRVPLTLLRNRGRDIRNHEVLLGAFELLILDHVDLLFELDEALGRDGRVILFDDVYQDVLSAPRRLADRGVLFEYIDRMSDGLQPNATRASARDRARRVRSWVVSMEEAGKLTRIERPIVELPPPREHPEARELHAWFLHALSWREALRQHANAMLLCVDARCAEGVTEDAPATLNWALVEGTSDQTARTWERLDTVADRVVSFAAVCRELAGAQRRTQVLKMLARLGIVDAFQPEDLLRHFDEAEELPGHSRQHLLECIEESESRVQMLWPRHQMSVARLYARGIGEAWCGTSPAANPEEITGVLLTRAAGLGDRNDHGLMRLLARFLYAYSVDHSRASFVVNDGMPSISSESRAGKMWQAIVGWMKEQPEAKQREIIDLFHQEAAPALLEVDSLVRENPRAIQVVPLRVASYVLGTGDDRSLIVPGSLFEAIMILSALWPDEMRSWADLRLSLKGRDHDNAQSIDESLTWVARGWSERMDRPHYDGVSLHVIVEPGDLPLSLPPAAVLLRLSPADRSQFAQELILTHGPDDGRIFSPLQRIVTYPDDLEALRSYARLSIQPPWQTFRQHPESITEWGQSLLARLFPATLQALRAVLSEPEGLPAQSSLSKILHERVDDGVWKERGDFFGLLERCGEIVGAPSLPLICRRLSVKDVDINESLRRLDHAHDQPAARVAYDLFLCLRWAGSGESDVAELRARVSAIVHGLLEQGAAGEPHPADSLAACESRLLQHAMWTVAAMCLTTLGTSLREGLWLTWCLYQWMIRQLEQLPDTQKRAGWQKLAAISPERPGFTWTANPDLLDPSRFGQGRLDIRLLAILHALANAKLKQSKWLASDDLRDLLDTLRQRPLTQEEQEVQKLRPASVLVEWGDLPRTVPELAGHILARWYPLGGRPDAGPSARVREKRLKKKRRNKKRRRRN
jgi:tetratricopeptide (TPR) repeat protein